MEAVVLRALAKDPKARFTTVTALAQAFWHACQIDAGSLVPSRPSPAFNHLPPPEPVIPLPGAAPGGRKGAVHLIAPIAPAEGAPAAEYAPALSRQENVLEPPSTGEVAHPDPTPEAAFVSHSDVLAAAQRPAHPWRRFRLLPLHVGFAALLLLLTTGGVIIWQTTRFQQTIITGKYVTRIQVGVGYDPTTGAVQGANDTFQVGTTVMVVCQITGWTGYATARLLLAGTLADTQQVRVSDVGDFLHSQISYFSASVMVTKPGLYQWEITLSSTAGISENRPDASITFRVPG